MSDEPCTCGHSVEEHGHNPEYPGSTACIECECIAYEAGESIEYFATRGAVTKEVLANPAYHVIGDLIDRKGVKEHDVDVEELRKRFTMTVAEAAERLGVHVSAVRQAIAAHRLASWVENDRHYLDPKAVASFELERRGPAPAPRRVAGAPLDLRIGHAPGRSMRVRVNAAGRAVLERDGDGNVRAGQVKNWDRVVVTTGTDSGQRTFVLAPSDVADELELKPFFVRGAFQIVEKANSPKAAKALWEKYAKDGEVSP